MVEQTQKRPEEEIHGEPEHKPMFGPGSDDAKPAGKSSDPRGDKVASPENLKQAEQNGSHNPDLVNKAGQQDKLGKGYSNNDQGSLRSGGSIQSALLNKYSALMLLIQNNKKKTAGGVAAGGIIATCLFAFGIIQGPAQFVYLAQLFQQFHFAPNEDFGGDRSSKVLLYAIAGDTENGRLGAVGNKFANDYEEKLLKQGIKPVYDSSTGRFVGFATDDIDVANAMNRESGNKATIKNASDTSNIKGSKKAPDINGDWHFVDLRGGCDYGCRRAVIKNVGKSIGSNKISSAINSRLLKKRGGVLFHPLNKLKKKAEESDNDFIKKILRRHAEEIREGASASGLDTKSKKDENGNPVPPDNEELPDEVESAAEDGQADVDSEAGTGESTKEIFRGSIAKAGGGAALIVGILCSAQDFGDNVPDYKYTNNVLPMMRMGTKVITMGNQVMSGDDVSLDELKAYNTLLFDEGAKDGAKSVMSARSIQAELGQEQTGADLPEEARLNNVNDKPAFFDLLDKVPGLSQACDVGDFFAGLPIIKDISEAASSVIVEAANVPLSAAGTSVEDLSGRALATVAGDTINPYAKGAEYGNLANTGAFLAANDQAIANGGTALTNEEVAQLKGFEEQASRLERSNESIATRYFDLSNSSSAMGRVAISWNSLSFDQHLQHIINPLKNLASMTTRLVPRTSAATNYDYGVPKYGFSLEEREDDEFENPYENASIVEKNLDSGKMLNENYGQCFGMTATPTSTGVQLETTEAVNTFKLESGEGDYQKCVTGKANDPYFKRYRFYLADALAANSIACYEGDEDSCSAVGAGNEDADTTSSSGSSIGSSQNIEANKDRFTDILYLPKGTIGPDMVGYYHQCQDNRWANKPYPYASGGSSPICVSGCGPATLAMVISTLSSEIINPYELGQKIQDSHVSGGTAMSSAIGIVEEYGLKQSSIGTDDVEDVMKRGGLVVFNANPASPFTSAGHFVVIRAISDDGSKFYVADPADDNGNGQNRNQKAWPMSSLDGWLGPDGLYGVEEK